MSGFMRNTDFAPSPAPKSLRLFAVTCISFLGLLLSDWGSESNVKGTWCPVVIPSCKSWPCAH